MSALSDPLLPAKAAAEVDFPVERVEAEHVSRREFAKFLCVVSGGLTVGNGWVAVKDSLSPPHRLEGEVRVCRALDLPIGGTYGFTLPGSDVPYILIHLGDEQWRVFEQKCTHLSCAVFFQPKTGEVECPCHHGAFDAHTGVVLRGPPPRPLRRLAASVRDGEVFVSEPAVPPHASCT